MLSKAFIGFITDEDPCQLYAAPFDVRLPKPGKFMDNEVINVVQPDLCIICDPNKLDDKGCLGAPDLIIEILSPSTSNKDLTHKYDLYQESGVKEYWVVFPGEHVVMVHLLQESGTYAPPITYTTPQSVPVHIFNNQLKVDLEKVFVE